MAWMSEEAAATMLGVSFQSIRRRVGNGTLRVMRQGQQILVDIDVSRAAPSAPAAPPVEAAPVNEANPLATAMAAPAVSAMTEIALPPPLPAPSTLERIPVNPLASGTFSSAVRQHGHRAAARISARESVQASRWMGPAIWMLSTLLLSTAAGAVWVHHLGKTQLQEAERRYEQTVLAAQQGQVTRDQQAATELAHLQEQEKRSAEELKGLRSQLESARADCEAQRTKAAESASDLEEVSNRLADVVADRGVLSEKLESAQATIAMLRCGQGLAATVKQAGTAILTRMQDHEVLAANTPVPEASAAPEPVAAAEPTEPQDRALPTQPPRLGDENVVRLRPLVGALQ